MGVYEVKHFYYVRLSFIKKKLPFLVSISLNFEVHIPSCHIKILIINQVSVFYQTGRKKVINVKTPTRKRGIQRLARRNYKSLASTMFTSAEFTKSAMVKLTCRIRDEMQKMSSDAHDSILRDRIEAVKQFSWETVYLEYCKMIPTLIFFLESFIPNLKSKKIFICFVASLLLKCRHQRMGLVQRAISVMLYGNGSTKQVSF